jgi:hypothetical protein
MELTDPWILNLPIFAIGLSTLLGFLILLKGTFPQRLFRSLTWMSLISLFGAFLTSGLIFSENGQGLSARQTSWLPIQMIGEELSVGWIADPFSLIIVGISCLTFVSVLLNRALFSREEKKDHSVAALIFSLSAVSLAWISTSAWILFLAIGLAILGGFLSLAREWTDGDEGATFSIRFMTLSGFALLISVSGAAIYSKTAGVLDWHFSSPGYLSDNEAIGLMLFGFGAFFIARPFPFLPSIVSVNGRGIGLYSLVSRIFLAYSAYAILFRFYPYFEKANILSLLGWFAFVSSFLCILSGLFQTDWNNGLRFWWSGAYGFSVAGICLAGPSEGLAILMTSSVATVVFYSAASGISLCEKTRPIQIDLKAGWLRGLLFVSAAGGSGFVGFLSAESLIEWMRLTQAQLFERMAVTSLLLLKALLIWRLVWLLCQKGITTTYDWLSILSPILLSPVGIAFLWKGTVSGGAIWEESDRLFNGVWQSVFDEKSVWIDSSSFYEALGFYLSSVLLAFCIAYWVRNSWEKAFSSVPRLTGVLRNGYGLDIFLKNHLKILARFPLWVEKIIVERFWNRCVPDRMQTEIVAFSRRLNFFDGRLNESIIWLSRSSLNEPGKIFQLFQNGNIQWYIFFSVGSGLFVLLYFLVFRLNQV